MSGLTEEDKEKIQSLRREVFIVLGDVNSTEKTLSRIKNEATELDDKLSKMVESKNGDET